MAKRRKHGCAVAFTIPGLFERGEVRMSERIPHNQMKEMPFESGAGLAM
jgi:hypothetical protein